MTQINTDRIEKSIVLRASRARVWQALTNVDEFNSWFRVALRGSFTPGAHLMGPITYEGYEDYIMDITVDQLKPQRLISWRWHPGTGDRRRDLAKEPATLVTFELEDVQGGTLLRVVESGFDALPPDRWEEAYRGNEGGWEEQLRNIEQHLEPNA